MRTFFAEAAGVAAIVAVTFSALSTRTTACASLAVTAGLTTVAWLTLTIRSAICHAAISAVFTLSSRASGAGTSRPFFITATAYAAYITFIAFLAFNTRTVTGSSGSGFGAAAARASLTAVFSFTASSTARSLTYYTGALFGVTTFTLTNTAVIYTAFITAGFIAYYTGTAGVRTTAARAAH